MKLLSASLLALALILNAASNYALAHTHDEQSEKVPTPTLSIKIPEGELSVHDRVRLENIVTLLRQLVMTLTEIHKIRNPHIETQSQAPAPSTTDTEMTEHHELHEEHASSDSETESAEKKLVIEIEPHFGKTHAHVRYTDKPEEMFFVDSSINNEDGIVSEIASHTGLGADVVKAALKYMQ